MNSSSVKIGMKRIADPEDAEKPGVDTGGKGSIYRLNTELSGDLHLLFARLISLIKHKVPSVQIVIYLGQPPVKFGPIYLLIITANDEKRQANELTSTIEESCKAYGEIIALVHRASDALNSLYAHNHFFCRALRCPAIYLSGQLLLPSVLPANCPEEENLPLWDRWFSQAKDFYCGAEYYLQVSAFGPALFSLHQAAECLLLAAIRRVAGYRTNTHNLGRLLKLTQMFTSDLADRIELQTPGTKTII